MWQIVASCTVCVCGRAEVACRPSTSGAGPEDGQDGKRNCRVRRTNADEGELGAAIRKLPLKELLQGGVPKAGVVLCGVRRTYHKLAQEPLLKSEAAVLKDHLDLATVANECRPSNVANLPAEEFRANMRRLRFVKDLDWPEETALAILRKHCSLLSQPCELFPASWPWAPKGGCQWVCFEPERPCLAALQLPESTVLKSFTTVVVTDYLLGLLRTEDGDARALDTDVAWQLRSAREAYKTAFSEALQFKVPSTSLLKHVRAVGEWFEVLAALCEPSLETSHTSQVLQELEATTDIGSPAGMLGALLRTPTWVAKTKEYWATLVPNASLGPEVQQAAADLAAAGVTPTGPLCPAWGTAVVALPLWRAKMRSGATAPVEESMLCYLEKVHAALCSTAGAAEPSFAEAACSALETAAELLRGAKMSEWVANARSLAQQAARRKAASKAMAVAAECTTKWSPEVIDQCHAALGLEQPNAEDIDDAERGKILDAIQKIEQWIGEQDAEQADADLLRKAITVIRRFAVVHGSHGTGPLAEVEQAVSCLAARQALLAGSAAQRPRLMGELQEALAAPPYSTVGGGTLDGGTEESGLATFARAARSSAQASADERTAEQAKAAETALREAHAAMLPLAGGAADGSLWKARLVADGAEKATDEAAWQKLLSRAQETLFQVDGVKMNKAHKDLKKVWA